MRRLSLPLVVAACVALAALLTWLVLSSAGFGDRATRADAGSARAETAARALPPFTRLDVSGMAEVVLVQGAAESVALAALLTWLVLSSAGFGDRATRADAGPARADPATRALPPFTRLDVSGMAEVVLVQGAAESVAVAAGGRKAAPVEAQVRGDTLYLTAIDDSRWWDRLFGSGGVRAAHVVVNFRELAQVDAAGTVSSPPARCGRRP